jgi:hypothetical protein
MRRHPCKLKLLQCTRASFQAARLGMTRIILEMDATVLVSALTIGYLVHRIRDVIPLEFSFCIVSVCN